MQSLKSEPRQGLKSELMQFASAKQDLTDTVAQTDASPVLRKSKRMLNISPSTPIGPQRKLLVGEESTNIQIITFNQDVEMLDLDNVESDQDQSTPKAKFSTTDAPIDASRGRKLPQTPGRRVLTGLRRRAHRDITDTSKLNNAAMPSDQDLALVRSGQVDETRDKRLNMKGISVKVLKQESKERGKDYKARKKKTLLRTPKLDHNQRLIYDFYSSTPNNNLVGLDTNEEAQNGSV